MELAGGSANCIVVNVVLVILVLFICQYGNGNIGPIYLSMWYLVILVLLICQCGIGNIGPIYLSIWYW